MGLSPWGEWDSCQIAARSFRFPGGAKKDRRFALPFSKTSRLSCQCENEACRPWRHVAGFELVVAAYS